MTKDEQEAHLFALQYFEEGAQLFQNDPKRFDYYVRCLEQAEKEPKKFISDIEMEQLLISDQSEIRYRIVGNPVEICKAFWGVKDSYFIKGIIALQKFSNGKNKFLVCRDGPSVYEAEKETGVRTYHLEECGEWGNVFGHIPEQYIVIEKENNVNI